METVKCPDSGDSDVGEHAGFFWEGEGDLGLMEDWREAGIFFGRKIFRKNF